MSDIQARVERVIEELMGNEALLEMLETDAATEMLNWGIEMAKSLVKKTDEMDEPAANLSLLPRLKEIRQSMRSIGNWAAGKYTDDASRKELRNKLLEKFRVILGERTVLPTAVELDRLLGQADDKNKKRARRASTWRRARSASWRQFSRDLPTISAISS